MKRLFVGFVALAALAEPASAIKVKMPDVLVDMTRVDSRDAGMGKEVFVTVHGLTRPEPENVVLYPAGLKGKAVHPTVLRGERWKDEPVALAIVYQGTSQKMVGAVASAFTAFKHGTYPAGSQLTVVEYTDRVDVRLPWSDISALGPDVFKSTPAAKPSARAAAIAQAASELSRSRLARHVLVIVGDACDLTGYPIPFDNPPEIMNFVIGTPRACKDFNDRAPGPYVVSRPGTFDSRCGMPSLRAGMPAST